MSVEDYKAKAENLKPKKLGSVSQPAPEKEPEVEDIVSKEDFYPPKDLGQDGGDDESEGLTAKAIDDMKNYFMALQNPLAAPDVRERIESRLEPLDIGSLLLTEEVRQEVPIVPGLVAVFRTMTAEEDMHLRSTLSAEDMSMELLESKRAIYSLAMGLFKLNGQKISPWHLGKDGVSSKAVEERVAYILKLPMPVVSSLSVNYSWFQDRVTLLLGGEGFAEQVKNG